MAHNGDVTMVLPLSLISRSDVVRLNRELDGINEFLEAAALRKGGKSVQMPRTSHMLEEVAAGNACNLLVKADRHKIGTFLSALKTDAPVLHISFAAEPSAAFMRKLIAWFRGEIDPRILLQIGLQPDIAAGCTLRTPNRFMDLSLRRRFVDNRAMLMQKISELA